MSNRIFNNLKGEISSKQPPIKPVRPAPKDLETQLQNGFISKANHLLLENSKLSKSTTTSSRSNHLKDSLEMYSYCIYDLTALEAEILLKKCEKVKKSIFLNKFIRIILSRII